jgi:hypothetical protein
MNTSAKHQTASGMGELLVESWVDPTSWNASLCACGGTIFHAAEWATYSRLEQPNAVPEFYTLLDDAGSVAGVALGFRATSSRRVAAAFSGHRWLDALPAMRDKSPNSLSRFVELIEGHAREAGDVTLEIGSFTSPGSEAVLQRLGFSIARRLEFELDLQQAEKTLWAGMNLNRQRAVKRAMKSGVQVKELPRDEGVSHLRRLQEESFVRIAARGGPALDKRESVAGDPITSLINAGVGHIVGGFVDGVCVSATFFTNFNGVAYYTLAGHDAKGLESRAPTLVVWEMILRLQSEGALRLNLGGCSIGALQESSPEHGVYTYKEAFGGARLDCANGEKILRRRVHRAANLLRGVMRQSR